MQGVEVASFASESEAKDINRLLAVNQACGDGGNGRDEDVCALYGALCLMLLRGIRGPLGDLTTS